MKKGEGILRNTGTQHGVKTPRTIACIEITLHRVHAQNGYRKKLIHSRNRNVRKLTNVICPPVFPHHVTVTNVSI
jgi:hypothetical protein